MLSTTESMYPTAGGGIVYKRPELDKAAETYRSATADGGTQGERGSTRVRERSKTDVFGIQDKVEINFSLSREERDAFVNAFSSDPDQAAMTEEEKETLQKASERISKFIEDAIARHSENRERVEGAVREWYASITKGEDQGRVDLIHFLHQAAMGNLDGIGG